MARDRIETAIFVAPRVHITAVNDKQQIGQGGGGSVSSVNAMLSNGTQKRVAVKELVISAGRSTPEPIHEENLRREIETLQNLAPHPNIVKFYGACTLTETSDGTIRMSFDRQPNALVMELAPPPGSLSAVIDDPTQLALPWHQRIILCLDIGLGLEYLHDVARLEHRDIKPDNVLVIVENGLFNAKLTDFGLTKRRKPVTGPTGNLVSTYEYMAPETLRRDPIVNVRQKAPQESTSKI